MCIRDRVFFFYTQRKRWLNVPRRRHEAEHYTGYECPSGLASLAGKYLLDGTGLGQMKALDIVDADLLEHLEHLGALDLFGNGGNLHRVADLCDGLDHAAIHNVVGYVCGEVAVNLKVIDRQRLQVQE